MKKEQTNTSRRLAVSSVLLLLIALASISAVTLAWFSITDHTRVYSMDMDVTTGAALRFDLDEHGDFFEYSATLSSEQIFERIQQEYGYDPWNTRLRPVTTSDGRRFTLRNGTEQSPETGSFLKFTLHFMSTEDMFVHLTSENSKGNSDGTYITSYIENLPSSMRVSFSIGENTVIYDPDTTNSYEIGENILVFGLPQAGQMLYNNDNGLFHLLPDTDTKVDVCIWMEGTDEACTDEVKNGDFSIRFRFVGTDENNKPI